MSDLISKLKNKIIHTTAEKLLEHLPENSIDLIVTSPPYGNLRDYNGFSWNFEKIAHGSYRVLKPGGVLVWVVGDRVIKRSETLEPMRQAIYFKDCVGFLMHDTMIYRRSGGRFPESNRYWQVWEYMFILTKNLPITFNPCKEKSKGKQKYIKSTERQTNGDLLIPPNNTHRTTKEYKNLDNVWDIHAGYNQTKDKIAFNHPATYPELLAQRHILTWSNKGDVVLDYFSGSGTTAKMAMLMARNYIGCDISKEYVDLANERLELYRNV